MQEINELLNERGKSHGEYSEMAETYTNIKAALPNGKLSPIHETALDMIAIKMARIVCGNPNNVDSWRDIAGYASLVVLELDDA